MIIVLKIIGLVVAGALCWIGFRGLNEAFSLTHPGWDDEPKRSVSEMEKEWKKLRS